MIFLEELWLSFVDLRYASPLGDDAPSGAEFEKPEEFRVAADEAAGRGKSPVQWTVVDIATRGGVRGVRME